MRIDVAFSHRDVDAELARLHARMHTPGDSLHGLPAMPCPVPGFALRYREVAGEFYVYVEDSQRGVLAGCTVFNRAFELDARAQRSVRSPHSRYGTAYQRKGLATAVYGWALGAGMCLVSGPRQSPAAFALWRSLGATHPLLAARIDERRLVRLDDLDARAFERLDTRLLLLGAGWDEARFAGDTGFALPVPALALEACA